jgi:hypothetical protein
MGCTASNSLLTIDLKPYEIPIKNDLTLLPTEFEDLNKKFNESKLYLKEFELIKLFNYHKNRINLLHWSLCFKQPKFRINNSKFFLDSFFKIKRKYFKISILF